VKDFGATAKICRAFAFDVWFGRAVQEVFVDQAEFVVLA
jgi:hypothetical protein